jgi:galactonate dehydratase
MRQILMFKLGWLDSPHALDATVQRLAEVKSIGLDVGL